jgi:hypothetical protein
VPLGVALPAERVTVAVQALFAPCAIGVVQFTVVVVSALLPAGGV